MQARSTSSGGRFFLPAVLLLLGGLAVGTSSGQPAKPDKPDKKEEAKEKTVKFAFDGKAWRAVFEWLAETTGKPVVTNFYPTGTFTFIGPANKEYTIPQVIDILNEALLSNSQTNKYYLINRERSFTLVPADERIDMVLLPRIIPDEMSKHGDTELVSMVLPLKTLVADDVAPQIKKMMGPFGEAIPMTHTNVNNLILLDTVGNLKLIVKMIDDIDKNEGNSDSYSKKLDYIRARDAERILKDLLGDPAKVATPERQRHSPAAAAAAAAVPAAAILAAASWRLRSEWGRW